MSCFIDKPPNCTGTGAAAIVVIPTNGDTPLALRITQPARTSSLSPYLWELLAQTAAIYLTTLLKVPATILSDCKAAIANTSSALSLATTTPLPPGADTLLRITNTLPHAKHVKLRFIRSHPENNPARATNPSTRDKAIFLADRVADASISTCTLGSTTLQIHTTTVTSNSILDDIIPLNLWYLSTATDTATPVLHDYQSYQHRHQHRKMVEARDDASDYPTEYWRSTYFLLADFLQPLPHRAYWRAARRAQVLYDKVGHGRNRARLSTDPDTIQRLEACHLCGAKDRQEHLIHDCTYPPLTADRAAIKLSLQKAAAPLLKSRSRIIYTMAQQFIRIAWFPHRTRTRRLWLGLWSPELVSHLFCYSLHPDKLLSPTLIARIKAAARKLTRPLRHGYLRLLQTAHTSASLPRAIRPILARLPPSERRHMAAAHTVPPTGRPSTALNPHHTDFNLFDHTNHAFCIPNVDPTSTESDTDPSPASDSDSDPDSHP